MSGNTESGNVPPKNLLTTSSCILGPDPRAWARRWPSSLRLTQQHPTALQFAVCRTGSAGARSGGVG
eukprot:2673317-Prymnesium_polylepis.1